MNTALLPLRGSYTIRNPILNGLFLATDWLLHFLLGSKPNINSIPAPKKILLCNVAHLGDIVMATSVLPVLKSAFPEVEIGFLVGSWSQVVVRDHPMIRWVHTFDHAMHNRAAIPFWRKMGQHRQSRRKALEEIKQIGYDVAIDLYWNVGNTLPLLWQTGIPVRIGYSSGGFGPLATHPRVFKDTRVHASQRYLTLLRLLPIRDSDVALLHPTLAPVSENDRIALRSTVESVGLNLSSNIVCHVAGMSVNHWPDAKWRVLTERLTAEGFSMIFTGAGFDQRKQIERIIYGLSGCENLCDRLRWSEFVAAIQEARLLVSADTVAAHIAGAVETPCAVIAAGRWPYLWRPFGNAVKVKVLSLPLSCSPCHRNNGCATMECIRDVSVEQVYDTAMGLLMQDESA
jgi:ADP-heptose:LPS heptosyltransferase